MRWHVSKYSLQTINNEPISPCERAWVHEKSPLRSHEKSPLRCHEKSPLRSHEKRTLYSSISKYISGSRLSFRDSTSSSTINCRISSPGQIWVDESSSTINRRISSPGQMWAMWKRLVVVRYRVKRCWERVKDLVHMVLSNLKVTGCGKVLSIRCWARVKDSAYIVPSKVNETSSCGKTPGEKVLSNSQNLVIFLPSKVRETSCVKVPGEKVLSNSWRLAVVRYLMGAEQ